MQVVWGKGRQTKEVHDESQGPVGRARNRACARDRTARPFTAKQGGCGPENAERLPADHAAESGCDNSELLQPRVRAARQAHADDERAEPLEVPGVPRGL